jgi:PilZ domain-containing protein
MERRKHTRYRVEYAGLFSGEKISAPGVILDLSTAGCRARSATGFHNGEFLVVLINVPRHEHPLHVPRAVVRWWYGLEFGMEFIQMEPDDQQRLRELIRPIEAAKALRQHTETP